MFNIDHQRLGSDGMDAWICGEQTLERNIDPHDRAAPLVTAVMSH